ncbi:hypothetical protein OE88DRAFT_1698706 [Heliocybe sulcata]|uniref:Formin binding protein n=1 Tax=Heliocybe sulcata TaxID=5364 RepID=A0A5C3N2N3_9AGAM|nr:hypothetical protein OE88DRAFT_1698706 [Heliocybe sulcata]
MSSWTEHRNPEGRTYWFNALTKESVWEKPDDLKTPFQRALNQTKWKEYFSSGRKYYYNTESKESKWDMPDELLLLLENVERDNATSQQSLVPAPAAGSLVQGALVPNGGSDMSLNANNVQSPLNGTNGAVGLHTGQLPFQAQSVLPARPNLPDDPVIPHNGFTTYEEGEKAFMHLLRKAGVDANWTWDQTMRTIITDPLYKALNTLAEKKAAWQKYTDALRAKEQEERDARLSKLRPAIRNMLKGNPLVFHYTTFTTADKLFAQHPIWQQAKLEAERRLIFEEYVAELKQREVQETRAARSRSISKVVSLFKQLDVDVLTRWRTAHQLVVDSEEWKNDSELQKLPTLDILLAFEDYSRVREREFEEQMRRNQVEKTRKERKAREGFKSLLHGLVEDGKIKARTKWKTIYPLFKDDERYLNMLGKPGSNPLELFWDLVDGLDQKLDAKVIIVEGAISKHNAKNASAGSAENPNGEADEQNKGFIVTSDTKLDEFVAVVRREEDDGVRSLSDVDLQEVFKTLRDQAIKKQEDDRRRTERKQRHLQDDLRYALKKLSEPIDLNMSYEDAVPLMEHLPEYKALEDEGRRAAFTKYIKRQKERLREKEASEDGGSTTSRKRKEPSTKDHRDDRDKDEERDRKREREPYREREKEHDARSSRHHSRRGYDEYEHPAPRSSREYRDRERERDFSKEKDKERDRTRDYYRSSKHHRDFEYDKERDDKPKDRRGSRSEYGSAYGAREWEEVPVHATAYEGGIPPPFRERSASVYREEPRDKRERSVYGDREYDERAEKRARHDPELAERNGEPAPPPAPVREETPEEGEI